MKKYIIISLLLSSCSLVKIVETNPEPKLKTIHMWEQHRNYTIEEYNAHPDHDCEIKQLNK